ncbi:MAG: arginine deiminase family protein [Gemmatimonadota bacterium]
MPRIAITRQVSTSLEQCALTFLEREPIDVGLAARQHAGYEAALRESGVTVEHQNELARYPDAVFVEDTALVLDEIAVITRPGEPTRRGETEHIAPIIARYRPLATIESPAKLEGGDIVRLGKRLFVGLSSRSSQAGADQLRVIVEPFGYTVDAIHLEGALHLKSAVSALDGDTILAHPAWVDTARFGTNRVIAVAPGEPMGGNVLAIDGTVIVSDAYPRTREQIERAGFVTKAVTVTELHKAEAGVTCMSLVFKDAG